MITALNITLVIIAGIAVGLTIYSTARNIKQIIEIIKGNER